MPMGRSRVESLVVVPPCKPPAEYDERKGQSELDEKPHGVAVDFRRVLPQPLLSPFLFGCGHRTERPHPGCDEIELVVSQFSAQVDFHAVDYIKHDNRGGPSSMEAVGKPLLLWAERRCHIS